MQPQSGQQPSPQNVHQSSISMWGVILIGLGAWGYETWRKLNEGQFHSVMGLPAWFLERAALALGVTVALVLALAEGSLIAYRYSWRKRRAQGMRVHEIVLGPNDTAEPYEVMSALDAIHGQISTRYFERLVGQDPFTFEIVRLNDGSVHFLLAAACEQYDWLKVIEDTLQAKYTNIRFEPWNDEYHYWRYKQQIVLSKAWYHATETLKDYQNSVVETIVQALDRAEGPCHLQIHLTPMQSEQLHKYIRDQVRFTEREARAKQQADPTAPGVGYADSQAVKDSLQLYGKAVYRTEIRLGADDWGTVQRVYGAMREANGENTFVATTVWMFASAWNRWFYQRLPSVLFFGASPMFSFPLATIIHLPTNRPRVSNLNRFYVRRAPAPREIARAPSEADAQVLDYDSRAPLTILERDRRAGILDVGVQGSGKTTDALSIYRSDVRYLDGKEQHKAVVLVGIGKDTEKRALGMTPPGRKLIYYAPGDPDCPWTLNPIKAAPSAAVMSDNVIGAMREVFGEDAIQWRSREFLGNAFSAVKEVLGDKADFVSAYTLLTDDQFRNDVVSKVQDEHLKAYWQQTFARSMASNPRFLEEGLAAPRNKLDELLRNPLIRNTLSEGPQRRFLDLRRIVAERSVLVVNLDKARLGEGGTRLLGIFLVMLLWYALQGQNDIEEKDRAPVSLILDEAQNYISAGFLNMLAEGRAYGLQVTLAVRFLGEIKDERVIQGMRMLLRNVILHQFQDIKEAHDFMEQFMRTYADMVQVNAESQDAINVGVDDLIRLPEFTSVCRWMVNGTVQPAFLARTINWEEFYTDEWRLHHEASQREYAEIDEVLDLDWPAGSEPPADEAEAASLFVLPDEEPAESGSGAESDSSIVAAFSVLDPAASLPSPPVRSQSVPSATATPTPIKSPPRPKSHRSVVAQPGMWRDSDPRRVFCDRYKVDPMHLVRSAQSAGVDDDDMVRACEWALRKDLDENEALPRVRIVFRLKVEDKLLRQVSHRFGCSVKDIRERLNELHLRPAQIRVVLDEHPALESLDLLLQEAAGQNS